jgi:hypothetical protein
MTAGGPVPPAQDGLEAFAALAAHQLGEAVALMRGAAWPPAPRTPCAR